jgi:L-histidine N-alpha-methyltransferase
MTGPFTIAVHLGEDDMRRGLRDDVHRGLCASPKWLPPKWFYDERGCALFEQITRLPEYYPTAREREILERRADEIAAATDADTLVELGSGSSAKTRILLDALRDHGTLRRFVPFDVSEPTLRDAGTRIVSEYPGVHVHAVVGDFERHLGLLPREGRRLVAFLGGTVGNLAPAERAAFLTEVAGLLSPGDALLVGTDLVKDEERLVRAYDDDAGVTAAFNRNVLHVVNRELAADFVPGRFAHVARWNADEEWIEMRLRSEGAQQVRVGRLDLAVHFDDGEELRTEISAKFRRARLESELGAAGLVLRHWWTDAAGDFALSLAALG